MCSYKTLLIGDDAYLIGALILLNMLDESKRPPTQSKNSPCIMLSAVIIKYYCFYVREMSGLYCVLRHGNTVICYLYHFKTNPHQCFSKYYSNFMRFNFFYNLILFANSYMTIYAQFFLPITFHVSKKPTNQKPYLQNRFYYIFNS